ncbi:hypothetical protein COT40_00810 [Candidatus Peregrinibacteria bacterium CG08_land_8_20_14_0_20_41_10]|nr:MAG: hypothetical protein COT40_00810 [Candidatus Peregrinibacteria bacterium CG08_land_8_20_14_0_20_41_10]
MLLKKELSRWQLVALVILLALVVNSFWLPYGRENVFSWWDGLMLWVTEPLAYISMLGVLFATVFWSKKRQWVLPFWLSFLVTLWLVHFLKNFLQMDRPYLLFEFNPLIREGGFSFPSSHTAAIFALAVPLLYAQPRYFKLWLIWGVVVAFSRLYVGVHFLHDVLAGAGLGLATGYFFSWLEAKHFFFSRLNQLLVRHLEVRRQLVHLALGAFLIFLFKTELLTKEVLLIVLVIGSLCSYLCKYCRVPFLYRVLQYFEREEHLRRFPGKGIVFFLVGSLLVLVLFPQKIAFAAIVILAVGDSVTNVVGRYYGGVPNPWNKKKNIEGTIAGIIFAFMAASLFVSFSQAVFASIIAMFLESLDVQIGKWKIDDNLLIPLVAGMVMLVLGIGS